MLTYMVKFLQDVIKDVKLRKLPQNVQIDDDIRVKPRNIIHRSGGKNMTTEAKVKAALPQGK